ncbi:tail fiber assembly protein [Salmonella enterica subsp. enterica]|uniref:Tail fiber assembly protein n=1 Tax=Salmonella enterica I TaxID=59201 RepID=A0A612GM99_SALET|nr:tail fiber assembly protein [Salmonella enterica subsp. enterica]ECW0082952.1 tail fiber assembly protein [Salmonella enterica subsp. enterica]ECW0830234.1 tail fiber assembly protein [Salmonella enterica subsp. enterica]ECW0857142.1 tail fiber assembly protein [Salmonella enterica subsp. enterica]ECW0901880.1 tail fiber assembly protein [Salmonella enterica subsp. enterica]
MKHTVGSNQLSQNFSQKNQDAIDLGIATDEEKSQLAEWKKYRVLVNRVDTSNPDWPDVPVSQ